MFSGVIGVTACVLCPPCASRCPLGPRPPPAPAQTPVLSPRSCSTGWPSDPRPEEELCRAHAQVRGFATTPDTVLKILS